MMTCLLKQNHNIKLNILESFIGDFEIIDKACYYNNIAKRVKNREIDILLAVNMFLTGFDSKPLNFM